MSLSINIENVNWKAFHQTFKDGTSTSIKVHVSPKFTGLPESVEGTFDVSDKGFVYSLSSKKVLWLKFLGLAAYLSVSGAVAKCKYIALSLFKQPVDEKKQNDLKHIFKLAAIAGNAVIGKGECSLKDRVEEFAMEEINYNRGSLSVEEELDRPRSHRFTGSYIAKCMQPLFHVKQARSPEKLDEYIAAIKKTINDLHVELEERPKRTDYFEYTKMFSLKSRPYTGLSKTDIDESLKTLEEKLQKKERQLDVSQRISKYATYAILQQQGCLTQTFKNMAVDTQAEVECCGFMCYKQQQICGLIYKIDCCALQCFAMDCFCCFCCFWPAGRQACLIA